MHAKRWKLTWALGVALIVSIGAFGACGSDNSDPPAASASPTATSSGLVDIGEGLHGPAGLTATKYAEGIVNTAAFAFDAYGGLWVATAAYSDEGNDGVYYVASEGATPIEVVSGLHTPLGLLWIGDSLYVSSKESVDAFSGFDGTGFAEQQNVVTFPAGVGEVNGMALSPEGRIMLGVSAPCDHCTPESEWSGAVVSFLPDGSDLRVEASGIRAPIGLSYYPGTSDLLVSMNERDDLGDKTTGDQLGVVELGQDWGFPGCYGQGGTKCTGAPEALAVLDRHAAVSGVAIVTGELGEEVGTGAIVAEWSLGKVELVSLEKNGEAYTSSVSTLLTGLQNPVPVIVTPDGAVLVGDWATAVIYKIAG